MKNAGIAICRAKLSDDIHFVCCLKTVLIWIQKTSKWIQPLYVKGNYTES